MSSNEGYVLVIGAAGIDIKARPNAALTRGVDNLGAVRNSVGGVARNVAENLARLEVSTVLIGAVGRDAPGQRVIQQSRQHGVKCAYVRRVAGVPTGNYVALLTPDGELDVAVSDFSIMRHIDPDYLRGYEHLFAGAQMVVIDANLGAETLETVFDLAGEYRVRVCADPASPGLAARLCPYLDRLFLVTPNAAETKALCGIDNPAYDRDTAIQAARALVTAGVEIAVVTMGEHGVAYADGNGSGYIGAVRTHVVDATGAGDAFTAAVIFGLVNNVPVDEAMRLGVTAASLTLMTPETVVPNLSQELLYARLVV